MRGHGRKAGGHRNRGLRLEGVCGSPSEACSLSRPPGGEKAMRIFSLIFAAALTLGGCTVYRNIGEGVLSNFGVRTANDDLIARCLAQGTYADLQNSRCAPVPPQPKPSAEQIARQAEFDRRVSVRAARMTTGTLEMRRIQAAQDEIKLEDFCMRYYAQAAFIAVSYRDSGAPKETTLSRMLESAGVPMDLLDPLISAAYSNRYQSATGFAQTSQQRCLDGDPFR